MTSSRPAKSTRKYFVTSSGIHSDQEKYSAWEALHHAMAESPRHYPVNDWRYRHPLADAMDAEMDLWPVIKTLYMVGACHRVHAGTNNKPPAPALPAPAVPRALVTGTPPITRMRWPNLDCEILMLGSSVGNHDVDGYRAQHHLDPLREALSRYGMRSTTLLIDVKSEVAQPAPALLGATIGAAGIFRAIQSHLRPSGSLALDDLPGFEAWHADHLCVPGPSKSEGEAGSDAQAGVGAGSGANCDQVGVWCLVGSSEEFADAFKDAFGVLSSDILVVLECEAFVSPVGFE